jgi:hypothetical protein
MSQGKERNLDSQLKSDSLLSVVLEKRVFNFLFFMKEE